MINKIKIWNIDDNISPSITSLNYHLYYSDTDLDLDRYIYIEDMQLNEDFIRDNIDFEDLSNESLKIFK